ncbi:hypothetical protein Nos7524_1488 [Nostoc sp. PCC 7524]|jgi:hypothetical protein|uniref:hypothetical protein n=1 Tax=Nostoc sp. (strain ATCC 29411 / PCC 7524) TaxID=28072 RepID=UPI00029F302D|nr:hypothetical protein [Nostoc sp. PCC 7524]AFY47364.1 hypothetical protein Nos7524_1488 [Nostoc sp. PCC 7524]
MTLDVTSAAIMILKLHCVFEKKNKQLTEPEHKYFAPTVANSGRLAASTLWRQACYAYS